MSVLITIGDPLGIGPEVIVKTLKKLEKEKRRKIVIVGSVFFLKKAGWDANLCEILPVEYDDISDKNTRAALISFKAVELACKFAQKGWVKAIVTAPISKKRWFYANIPYNGHTDYFRKKFNRELLMSFVRKKVIGSILTEHIALKDVSRYVKRGIIIRKAKMLFDFLKKLKFKNPKIGISCLNPHCGENGKYGNEEIKHIKPAVKYLNNDGFKIIGPMNPDDCIRKNMNGEIAGSLFFYHDQLIPLIKAIDFSKNDVVHITYGLDFIRTSPTHGSADDIAGKGLADETSMMAAVDMALKLSYD